MICLLSYSYNIMINKGLYLKSKNCANDDEFPKLELLTYTLFVSWNSQNFRKKISEKGQKT